MPQENQDAARSVGGGVPSFPERPHLCLEPAGPADSALATGPCSQLTGLHPCAPPPPPLARLAHLLGGLTSGASESLPTPEAPQVSIQAQLIPPLCFPRHLLASAAGRD